MSEADTAATGTGAAPQARGTRELVFDVVVVGAGVAGLVAALDLADADPGLRIAIVDKGGVGSAGSTPLAQGGMAAAVGDGDSAELHAADTMRAGDGLCDPVAVAVLAAEGPARVAGLLRRGAVFDRRPDGSLALAREGGQTVPRSVRAADATGAEIFRALRRAATGRVTRVQGVACAVATAAVRGSRQAVGVWALLDEVAASRLGPAQEDGLVLVRGGAVLLATGGCGGLYASTTNRDGATADGVALAFQAGAALIDLEFVQFHPTALKVAADHGASAPGAADAGAGPFWRPLLTEALRGAGATLVDASGRRFLPERHPDAELAPRSVVTRAILDQPGGAWLDATGVPASVLAEEFPTVTRGVTRYGFDLAREPVPVEPAEHYMIGGVATDLRGRSTLPGLYAAGEVANTGVHGANRMAGNSLLQSCVFASRAAVAIAAELAGPDHPRAVLETDPAIPRLAAGDWSGDERRALRAEVRRVMSAGAGPIRSGNSLEAAGEALDAVAARLGAVPAATRDAIELHHALTVGRLILRSAHLRTESRGVHWREDAPSRRPMWDGVRLRSAAPEPV